MVITPSNQLSPLQKKRLEDFQSSIPCSYRFFYDNKFPRMDLATKLFEEWHSLEEKHDASPYADLNKQGLILFGASRTGKTRLACELVRRSIRAYEECDARFISAVEWAAEASTRAKNCELDGWARSLVKFAWRDDCDPGIVIIDDLDKLRCTPVIQSELFGLIEKITANDLTLIVTTNVTAAALADKFDEEFGQAITSRIRESCVPVNFNKVNV